MKIDALKRLGVWQTVKDLFLGPRNLVAVDIGSHAIKIVLLKQEGTVFHLKAWEHLPVTAKIDATIDERKITTIDALRGFLSRNDVKMRMTATSLSGSAVIVRYVKFPRLTRAELQATLTTEAEPFIPFDIHEVQLDFQILAEIVEEGQKKMETVLVAAKKDLVASRLALLEGAGFQPAIIDVDSFALENVHEQLRNPTEDALATLCLNIGHSATNLSIIENGVTRVVRDIFVSGQTMTKAVAKAFQCETIVADDLKKKHGFIVDSAEKEQALADGNQEALGVSQAVGQVARDLVAEVHRSVDFYLSQGPDRAIGRIVLSGGAARAKNLDQHLANELKVPVSILDPFSFVQGAEAVPPELRPAFGVAVGLALRRNRDWE